MAKNIKKIIRGNILVILLLLAIVLLGDKLRNHSYSTVPHPGEVVDEYCYGWLGMSLIKDREPIAWSIQDVYKNRELVNINIDGIYDADPSRPPFTIVKPYFDHPPLFSFITGGYAYLKGARDFVDASVILLRRPMLKIGIVTTLLIFWLGTRLYGKDIGLLSALFYSIIPTTVISSRLALMENGYIPLFLGALISADYYFEKRNIKYWRIGVAMASIGVLIKLSALSIGLSLILIALKYGGRKKKVLVKSTLIGLTIPVLVFIAFGAFYDWNTFVEVFLANSKRFYGASSEVILQVINQFRLTTSKFLTDGWITAGWISLFSLSMFDRFRKRSTTILILSVFSYLVFFVLFGSESYGWYKFPFFPFIVISLAVVWKRLFSKPNLFYFTIMLFLPFGSTLHRLIGVEGFQQFVPHLRLFMIATLGLFAALAIKESKRNILIYRIYMILVTAFVIWLSIKEILMFTGETWFFVT